MTEDNRSHAIITLQILFYPVATHGHLASLLFYRRQLAILPSPSAAAAEEEEVAALACAWRAGLPPAPAARRRRGSPRLPYSSSPS
jgi:hypothetical protein